MESPTSKYKNNFQPRYASNKRSLQPYKNTLSKVGDFSNITFIVNIVNDTEYLLFSIFFSSSPQAAAPGSKGVKWSQPLVNALLFPLSPPLHPLLLLPPPPPSATLNDHYRTLITNWDVVWERYPNWSENIYIWLEKIKTRKTLLGSTSIFAQSQ